MRKKIVAANWKLHKKLNEIREFFSELAAHRDTLAESNCEIIIAPTAIGLSLACELAKKQSDKLAISAQNLYFENSGAFTGEISAEQISDVGCSHVIIGHSERRSIFKEDDELIRKKIKSALNQKLVPIFCIGETLQERESNMLREVLQRQIIKGLEGIEINNAEQIIVAYEPVWAIGTGKSATPDDAQEAQAYVRKCLDACYGSAIADKIRILYGGSVKPNNTKSLLSCPDVDGALIGGASLNPSDFLQIISNSN